MSSSLDDSFPTPAPEDSDDVELALETAAALWAKGDRPEALRWLRRGAEAAEQAGNDKRALELARRAAELDASPPVGEAAPGPEPAAAREPGLEADAEAAPQASKREPLRVYVKTSARDPSLLIVRPLESGRKAPLGAREATLVFDEP